MLIKTKEKGSLIVISGPSGCGKDTVVREVMKNNKNTWLSVSCTSRAPRFGEEHGKDYFFLTKEEFEDKIKRNDLLEYASYAGNYYGTPKEHVEKLLNEGKNVLLEIEVQGALQVMAKVPDALTIFLVPPSMEELERRIRGRRTEAEDIVRQRLEKAEREIKTKDNYKHVVVNNTIDQAASEIAAIIRRAIKKQD